MFIVADLVSLNVLERLGILTDTQAITVVTFDFKGTRVRCFVDQRLYRLSNESFLGAKHFAIIRVDNVKI